MNGKSEWALVTAVIAAVLNWFVGFGWSSLNAEQASWIMAVVAAVAGSVTAIVTRPVAPSAFTYLITAVVGLVGAYGLHLSQGSVAAFSTVVLAVLALLTRAQVSPKADAPVTGVLGNRAA